MPNEGAKRGGQTRRPNGGRTREWDESREQQDGGGEREGGAGAQANGLRPSGGLCAYPAGFSLAAAAMISSMRCGAPSGSGNGWWVARISSILATARWVSLWPSARQAS